MLVGAKRGAASTIFNDFDMSWPGDRTRDLLFPGADTLPTELPGTSYIGAKCHDGVCDDVRLSIEIFSSFKAVNSHMINRILLSFKSRHEKTCLWDQVRLKLACAATEAR